MHAGTATAYRAADGRARARRPLPPRPLPPPRLRRAATIRRPRPPSTCTCATRSRCSSISGSSGPTSSATPGAASWHCSSRSMRPAVVRSLVLEEPAIYAHRRARGQHAMRDAIAAPLAAGAGGRSRAARWSMWMSAIARSWRADLMRTVPGGPQQTIDDAAAFFADVEAVDAWEFDRTRARGDDACRCCTSPRRGSAAIGAVEATVPGASSRRPRVAMIPDAGAHAAHRSARHSSRASSVRSSPATPPHLTERRPRCRSSRSTEPPSSTKRPGEASRSCSCTARGSTTRRGTRSSPASASRSAS